MVSYSSLTLQRPNAALKELIIRQSMDRASELISRKVRPWTPRQMCLSATFRLKSPNKSSTMLSQLMAVSALANWRCTQMEKAVALGTFNLKVQKLLRKLLVRVAISNFLARLLKFYSIRREKSAKVLKRTNSTTFSSRSYQKEQTTKS